MNNPWLPLCERLSLTDLRCLATAAEMELESREAEIMACVDGMRFSHPKVYYTRESTVMLTKVIRDSYNVGLAIAHEAAKRLKE